MTITDDDLRAIEERANKATEGPWTWEGIPPEEWDYMRAALLSAKSCVARGNDLNGVNIGNEDAAFIAHAREDIPRLIAEVRRLQREAILSADEIHSLKRWCQKCGMFDHPVRVPKDMTLCEALEEILPATPRKCCVDGCTENHPHWGPHKMILEEM